MLWPGVHAFMGVAQLHHELMQHELDLDSDDDELEEEPDGGINSNSARQGLEAWDSEDEASPHAGTDGSR